MKISAGVFFLFGFLCATFAYAILSFLNPSVDPLLILCSIGFVGGMFGMIFEKGYVLYNENKDEIKILYDKYKSKMNIDQ